MISQKPETNLIHSHMFTTAALRGNTVYQSNRLSNIVKSEQTIKCRLLNLYLLLGSTKSCPRHWSCMTLGVSKERKLCNIKIKTKMNLKTKIGLTRTPRHPAYFAIREPQCR